MQAKKKKVLDGPWIILNTDKNQPSVQRQMHFLPQKIISYNLEKA